MALLAPSARAAEPPPIAVLGLRPTQDAAFGDTAIAQLTEAQRLRLVVESVIEASSGTRVLGHDPLQTAVFRFQLAQPLQLAGPQPAVFATPAINRLFRQRVLPGGTAYGSALGDTGTRSSRLAASYRAGAKGCSAVLILNSGNGLDSGCLRVTTKCLDRFRA
jgi:hypothetical protein